MKAIFGSNTIWYILLGVLTAAELSFALYKAKDRRHVIALFIITSGIAFTVEAIIFCFLKSYNYYPMIIPHSPLDDGLAGNLFSQFSIASSTTLIVILGLRYYWFLVFSMVYGFIEELFLNLRIYSHNWYQTWMTVLGVTIFFGVIKKINEKDLIYRRNFLRYIFMSFGLYTLHMPAVFWVFLLKRIVILNTKILPDEMASYALIALMNLITLSILCMLIYFSKLKLLWKSAATSVIYALFYFAGRVNLIHVKEGWFLTFTTLNISGMYLCIFLMDKLMTKKSWNFSKSFMNN